MENQKKPLKVYMSLGDGIWLGVSISIGMGVVWGLVYIMARFLVPSPF